ncbi:MAG: hypothetical protein QF570_12265 [Myxococcota bacterium]|jgi:hypothetical protein|nr:hypothetical protein [Myxococcota bacterium]
MTRHDHKDTQRKSRRGWLPFLTLALACAFGQAAHANPHELPKTFTTIPSSVSDVAGETDGEDVTLRTNALSKLQTQAPLFKRYQKLKVLSYSREVELGHDEFVVKFQSPGKRRSFMMVELSF